MKLCKIVGLLVLSFLIIPSIEDIVYSQSECQFEQELQTYIDPIKIEDININTIVIGNFLSQIGNKDRKELIYGTFDSRIMVLNAVSLRGPFSIETNSTVKGIRLEDIESSDDEIKYNELISWDVNNTLYVHNKDLDLLFEEKIEYPIVDVTFLDADNNNEKDIIVATKNDIRAIDNKGKLIWQNTRFGGIKEILTVNFIEQEQNKIEEIVAKTENKILIYGFNGGFIKSIDFAPRVIKDLEIWKENGKDCLIVLTYDKENKISKVYKVSETDGKYLTYTVKENIKDIFPIDSKIYTGIENDFVILSYENRALEMINPTNLYKDNSYVWREKFDGNIVDIENFDLEGHLINSEEQYYPIINDNKEIIITTDSGDIYVYYWDQNDQEMKCYSTFQKCKKIKEKIILSKILDLEYPHNFIRILQISENNMIYPLKLFEKECTLIENYKSANSYYEVEDYKSASYFLIRCTDEKVKKIAEDRYPKIYEECTEKLKAIKEISEETKSKTAEKLENGIKFLNLGDYPTALKELFEAYKDYKKAGFDGQSVIYENITIENENVEEFTFWDLRGILFYLDLSMLKDANAELKKDNYESAIDKFVAMYPSFEYLNWNITGIILNYGKKDERFFQFEPLEENYKTTSMIKNVIETQCFKNLEEDAQSLMDESKYEEAKSQYEKLDDYRKKLGEKEDSDKRKEYEEKIEECDEKIRDIWLKWTILSIIIISAITSACFILRHFIKKKRRKEKTSAEFHLKLDEIEKNLEFDVTYAAQSAGRILELLLKEVIKKNTDLKRAWDEKPNKEPIEYATLDPLINFLKNKEFTNDIEHKHLHYLREIRNKASHGGKESEIIEEERVRQMIDNLRDYVDKFLD